MKKILILLFSILTSISPIPLLKVSAQSANFYTTGGGTVFTGEQINVTVGVNSDGNFNAVTVNVNYSNLTFLGASVTGGWTGVDGPTDQGGNVTFSGALLGSSASGSRNILNLSFRAPFNSSQSSISVSGVITAADGSGTKINGGGNSVGYSVVTPPPPPPPPDPAPEAVIINSSSHPDQNKWYAINSASFSWNNQDKVIDFSYDFNQTSDHNLDETAENSETEAVFSNLNDGIYYLHIRARNNVGWGPVSRYKINIDTTQPDPFAIASLPDADDAKKTRIYFSSFDALSGVASYTLKLDGIDNGSQKSGFLLPDNVFKVEVIALDNAGNKRSAELIIKEPIVEIPVNEQQGVTTAFSFNWISALIGVIALLLIQLLVFVIFKLIKIKKAKAISSSTIISKPEVVVPVG